MAKTENEMILGVEGGGSKTTWMLLTAQGERVVKKGSEGPGNVQLLSPAGLEKLFRAIRRQTGPRVGAIGAGMASCQLPQERARVESTMQKIWPAARRVVAMEDSRSALSAAFGAEPGIIVIAGTGSNSVGQLSPDRPLEKAGGWGHLFSDFGSSYSLAQRGLQQVYTLYDETREVSRLGREFLLATGCSTLEEMVPVLLKKLEKSAVAAYARCIFSAAAQGDRGAEKILAEGAEELARRTALVAKRLGRRDLSVALVGGLFENQPGYRKLFEQAARRKYSFGKIFLLTTPGALGAARVAGLPVVPPPGKEITSSDATRLAAFAQAATEQRNPRSRGLEKRSVAELVDLFIREEKYVEKALAAQQENIARAATLVAEKLRRGGRLFYVGAGTSGRLGWVDASEMPPTFNASPDQVQGIIAGGPAAMFRSQEGAEDDQEAGAQAVREVTRRDVVCGIAASGQTPYVLSALAAARKRGAGTILLTCNPQRVIRVPVQVEIDLPTGPELVTGSTRLKAGTATKLVLNILSTVAMIRLGRVQDNLMIHVQATNEKLRARAVRLVQALTGKEAATARAALEVTQWRVTEAVKN